MQSVVVDFGQATFSHKAAQLELHARATAALQSTSPHLSQTVSIDAVSSLLRGLWVRPRRPLCVSFTLSRCEYLSCLAQDVSELNEELLSTLSSPLVRLPGATNIRALIMVVLGPVGFRGRQRRVAPILAISLQLKNSYRNLY